VVVTDYPEDELILNISHNIENNTTETERENVVNVQVPPPQPCPAVEHDHIMAHTHSDACAVFQGHLWGASMEPLLAALSENGKTKFDVIIMADLIANHSQQNKLLQAAREALSDEGTVRTVEQLRLRVVNDLLAHISEMCEWCRCWCRSRPTGLH
jgi:nicotinamide N-methyltransferase